MAEAKKAAQFELTVELKAKLDAIAEKEGRSVANIVEFVMSRWLDSVNVDQFGMASHPAFQGLMSPPKKKP